MIANADQFEGLCFLGDVRENSNKHGLVHLQETLLSEIVGEKDIKLESVNKGIPIIKHRLHRMKVLLILDDVDELEQLWALVGGPDWFGFGSRVIITTRGFKLEEIEDILCTHHGGCLRYVIGILVEKSLIKINQYPEVTLHDLIQNMGREIVRKELPQKPGKRSWLWLFEDIVQVLEDNTGTCKIQIVILDLPKSKEEVVEWDGEASKEMKSLKTLIIRNGCFSQGPKYLPNSLRVLE